MVKELTSKERLLRALQLREPDRVPVTTFFNLFHTKTELSYTPLPDIVSEPSYNSLYEFALENSDFLQRHFFDTFVRRFFTEMEGNEYTHTCKVVDGKEASETTVITPKGKLTSYIKRSEAGVEKKALLENEGDIHRALSLPSREIRLDLSQFFRNREQLGDKGLMVAQIYNPLSCLYFNSNLEEYAIWLISDNGIVKKFLDTMFERIYHFLKHLLNSGVGPTFLIVGAEFATPPMVSPRLFKRLVVNYDRKLIRLIHEHNCYAIIHCHGNVREVLDDIASMEPDGLHPIESPPSGNCELSEAKRRIGQKVCLIGNIQIDNLRRSKKPEIDKLCKKAISNAGKNGGFILCPTTGPYEKTISKRMADNYIQFIESGRRYGRYPLNKYIIRGE